MKAKKTHEIRRLQDGSIDYAYYDAVGRVARHNEFKSFMESALNLNTKPGSVPAVLGLVMIVPSLASIWRQVLHFTIFR